MRRPNIALILVDQMRRDCMGISGHPVVETPTLDMMKRHGAQFTRAYSAVPSCIASRAAVLTGLSQGTHGRLGYMDGVPWDYPITIASEFARAGYHTQSVGKMHVFPERSLCGFHNVVLHDGYLHHARSRRRASGEAFDQCDDYLRWFRREAGSAVDLTDAGLECNAWGARPWPYAERLHPTNWCAEQSIDFLRRRDPAKPFFLFTSFVRPHSPLDPPAYYFDLYADRLDEMPEPPVGDWARADDPEQHGLDIDAKEGIIPARALKRARAAYYGSITHIDHQINRMLMAFTEYGLLNETIFLFASDHGDLLGDHHLFRKSLPYEGSAGVPFLIYDPGNLLGCAQNREISAVVELRDILPTLLDAAGVAVPPSVEGKSLLPLLRGESAVRAYLHGEHAYDRRSNHYIVTEWDKYICYTETGEEQYFRLDRDPRELHNAVHDPDSRARVELLRAYLVSELEARGDTNHP